MSKKKILLVDDSSVVQMMERMVLSRADFDLRDARDGVEALDLTLQWRPDLILMDIVMPRMDGLEACQRIRETDEISDIPIIMVTTRGETESIEKGFECGCNDYITKPVDNVVLLSKIRNILGE